MTPSATIQNVSFSNPALHNTHLMLWRIFKHDITRCWHESELLSLYHQEVQPYGNILPFTEVMQILKRQKYTMGTIVNKDGTKKFIWNESKIIKYVKANQPQPPSPADSSMEPAFGAPPKLDFSCEGTVVACEFLVEFLKTGFPSPIREWTLMQRFNALPIFKGQSCQTASFPLVLQFLFDEKIILCKDPSSPNLLYFNILKATNTVALYQARSKTEKVVALGSGTALPVSISNRISISEQSQNSHKMISPQPSKPIKSSDVECEAYDFLLALYKSGTTKCQWSIREEKLAHKYLARLSLNQKDLFSSVLQFLIQKNLVERKLKKQTNHIFFNIEQVELTVRFLQSKQASQRRISTAGLTPGISFAKMISSGVKPKKPPAHATKSPQLKTSIPSHVDFTDATTSVACEFLLVLHNCGASRNVNVPMTEECFSEKLLTFPALKRRNVDASLVVKFYEDEHIVVRKQPSQPDKLYFNVEVAYNIVTLYQKFKKRSTPSKPATVSSSMIKNLAKSPKTPKTKNVPSPNKNKSPAKSNRQKKTDQVVNNLMMQNGLVERSRQPEWSKVTGEFLVQNRQTFVDQRRAFRMGAGNTGAPTPEIFYPQDMDYCSVCAISFHSNEHLSVHQDADDHKFMIDYGNNRGKGSSLTPPEAMSGQAEGITIQSAGGSEGCNTFISNVIVDTEKDTSIDVCLEVIYSPAPERTGDWNLVNIFSVVGNDDNFVFETSALPYPLQIDETYTTKFTMECSHPGFKEFVLAFKFRASGGTSKDLFVMKRLNIRIDDRGSLGEDAASSRIQGFKHPTFNESHKNDEADYNIVAPDFVEQAELPQFPKHSLKVVHKLKDYPLPWRHIRFFNYGFSIGPDPWVSTLENMLKVLECFSEGLVPYNYAPFFQLLLFLEEHQTLCNLRVYAMAQTTIDKSMSSQNSFYLTVPGLAEKRPSVLKCDAIYITTEAGIYKGFVNLVELSRIRFSMGPSFVKNFVPKMTVSVHFSFNRSCLKVQHRALEIMRDGSILTQTLFPKVFGRYEQSNPIIHWFNVNIPSNPYQRKAVENILNCTSMPAPFLLFGPPGTGKTVTIVESIKQIYFVKKQSHILAVAPSNSAADLLALKVLDSVPPEFVIRLYSPSRSLAQVPLTLQHIANYKKGECVFPPLEFLKKFRVIVCTMICAGRLYSGNFPSGHFSHIFIDECGHGMEPSALVPIAGLQGSSGKPTQIVISGDPKQLGPIVHSPVALAMGLGDSFLVRLMDSIELYQKDDGSYNPKVLTKLIFNYRSHPQILKVPNQLFYDGELVPCGDANITASACDLPWLPQRGFPLVFHGVNGKDEQHPSSPSFFNTAEVYEVINYVKNVLKSKFNGKLLNQSDIGVVSPYRGQLKKISRALQNIGLGQVCVGSVEEFQGQERRVIIISTVRSNPAQLKLDQKFSLGFVREPKRFNVAVTRASALLIVIGNPHLLQTDHNWRTLLEHIYINGGYTHTNCPFSLGPPVDYILNHNQQLLNVRKRLTEQKEAIEKRIAEMKAADVGGRAGPAGDIYVDDLIDQIKKLTFFTEDGADTQNFDE